MSVQNLNLSPPLLHRHQQPHHHDSTIADSQPPPSITTMTIKSIKRYKEYRGRRRFKAGMTAKSQGSKSSQVANIWGRRQLKITWCCHDSSLARYMSFRFTSPAGSPGFSSTVTAPESSTKRRALPPGIQGNSRTLLQQKEFPRACTPLALLTDPKSRSRCKLHVVPYTIISDSMQLQPTWLGLQAHRL